MGTYSCLVCGAELKGGPVLYCDGCSGYVCMTCGIPKDNGQYTCPNCTSDLAQATL